MLACPSILEQKLCIWPISPQQKQGPNGQALATAGIKPGRLGTWAAERGLGVADELERLARIVARLNIALLRLVAFSRPPSPPFQSVSRRPSRFTT